MKRLVRNTVVIASLTAALSGVAANAAHLPPSLHDFGQPADSGSFERVIKITPETASVSVYCKETVKFVDGETGQNFVWRFDTPHTANFPLGEIAPAGFLGGQAVTAYVWDIPPPGAMLIL
jgi:Heavy-metal resistance protein CzcE